MFFGMEINLFILYMLKRKYFDLANLLRLIDEKNHHYLYFRDFNRLLRNTVKHVIAKKDEEDYKNAECFLNCHKKYENDGNPVI